MFNPFFLCHNSSHQAHISQGLSYVFLIQFRTSPPQTLSLMQHWIRGAREVSVLDTQVCPKRVISLHRVEKALP